MTASPAARILVALQGSKGKTARQLAAELGLDKGEVNRLLYRDLASRVRKLTGYTWVLRDDAAPQPATRQPEEGRPAPAGPLARLCSYYLDCLLQQDEKGVSVFASGQHGVDYEELTDLPVLSGDHSGAFQRAGASRLLAKARQDRGSTCIYLGYPVRLRFMKSARTGWEGFFVEPLFIWLYQFGGAGGAGEVELFDETPSFNFAAIKALGGFTGNAMDEVVALEDELGMGSRDELPEVDDLVLALRAVRPEWPWVEEPDASTLASAPGLSDASRDGIYNRAIVVAAERKPYTLGLEYELAQLRDLPASALEGTALGYWLRGGSGRAAEPAAPWDLLEPIPLNNEQRTAVGKALRQQMTVITGPPGTGKSQVVSDLLVNAAWKGRRTLFASKNNKAVDVVETRVNALGPRPTLIRTGTGEYEQRLVEYLNALRSGSTGPHDEERYREEFSHYERLRARLETFEGERARVVESRNTVDRLEREVEGCREALGEELFSACKKIDFSLHAELCHLVGASAARADRDAQPFPVRLFWPLVGPLRIREFQKCAATIETELRRARLPLPATPASGASPREWRDWSVVLNGVLGRTPAVRAYFEALGCLASGRSLEEIARDELSTLAEIANVSERLWRFWLNLQPGRLTREDRRLLGDYASVLQLVIQANQQNRRLDREIIAKKKSLFTRVSSLLPCWAVTSLSARGRIPFAPACFDLVLFDEASQCDVASALPLLYRARRAAVIGDPMQLRHISALTKTQDEQLLVKHGLLEGFASWAYSVNSLFDLASGVVESADLVDLRDHHRSHADIIGFSNRHFYAGKLRVATKYERLRRPEGSAAVRWRDVRGTTIRTPGCAAVNEEEARAVVEELRRLILVQGYKGSIGVVSPFRGQANRIRDLVNQDDGLSRALSGADFIADTVHRFQGDERDVVVFSPAVGEGISKGALGFLRRNPNLFNVAVTRARGALIVVGDAAAARESGVDYLREFATYVAGLTAVRGQPAREGDLGPSYPAVPSPEKVSDWERLLYGALYAAGIRPIPQYVVDQYALDLAVMSGERRLDIEVDGERYHRSWDGELLLRDRLRNQRLVELGWDVRRFWVYQVRDDLPGCVEAVKGWMDR